MKSLKLPLMFSFMLINQAFASISREPDLYKKIQIKNYIEDKIIATRTEKQIIAFQLTNLTMQQNALESQKEETASLKTLDKIDYKIDQLKKDQDLLQSKNKKYHDLLKIYKQQVRKFNDEFVATKIETPTVIIAENGIAKSHKQQTRPLDIESILIHVSLESESPTSTACPPLTPRILRNDPYLNIHTA